MNGSIVEVAMLPLLDAISEGPYPAAFVVRNADTQTQTVYIRSEVPGRISVHLATSERESSTG
jgi:hypothetical protein